jgi:enterobactin synthetase component D
LPDSVVRFAAWGIKLPGALDRAVLKRKIEYLSGRFCALSAFREAGYRGHTSLPANADRSPAWPNGWQGSISHCTDVAVAIAANSADFLGLGVDVENVLEDSALGQIADDVLFDGERRLLREVGVRYNKLVTLGFSLKESLYKALWPQGRTPLEFHHARLLDLCPVTKTFAIELRGGASSVSAGKSVSGGFSFGFLARAECDMGAAVNGRADVAHGSGESKRVGLYTYMRVPPRSPDSCGCPHNFGETIAAVLPHSGRVA